MIFINNSYRLFLYFFCILFCAVIFQSCREVKHEWAIGEPFPKEKLKVAIIHVSSEGETIGYAYSHELGISQAMRNLGLSEDQILRRYNVSDTDEAATEHALYEVIAEGANVIISTSINQLEACLKLSARFPHILFVEAAGNRYTARNLTNFYGKIWEPRYLSGLVAGLKTKSNIIGYVAARGLESGGVTSGINAFALGVERVNPIAKIYVKITHRWYDPNGEALATRELIGLGADVITHHTNTASSMTEAEKNGVFAIGYNSDMRIVGPKSVMTSVVWNWGVYYTKLFESIINGKFTTRPYLGDMEDELVGLTPFNETITPSEAIKIVNQKRQEILNNEFSVFTGELITNDKLVVGEIGVPLTTKEILNIHWYYRNVVTIADKY
jgi:basic membrane protein A